MISLAQPSIVWIVGDLISVWLRSLLIPGIYFPESYRKEVHYQDLCEGYAGSCSWSGTIVAYPSVCRRGFPRIYGISRNLAKERYPTIGWQLANFVPWTVVYGFYNFEIVLFFVAWWQVRYTSLPTIPNLRIPDFNSATIDSDPPPGRPLFVLAAVYSLLLTTISLKAGHGYAILKAILTWIIPILFMWW